MWAIVKEERPAMQGDKEGLLGDTVFLQRGTEGEEVSRFCERITISFALFHHRRLAV